MQTRSNLVAQHGDGAELHTVTRADKLLAAGDMAGQAVWKRVPRAIDELRIERRPHQPRHGLRLAPARCCRERVAA